jgi:hypothetical protein
VSAHPGPCITALTTAAENASPSVMSCGFSSEYKPKSGSTIDTAGSVPAAASAKNACVDRRCRAARASPSGYRSAVNDLLPRTAFTTPGSQWPTWASRRSASSPPVPSSRRMMTETGWMLW